MSDRTVAFVLGGVTVLAWMVVGKGLSKAWLANHPDSGWSRAIAFSLS